MVLYCRKGFTLIEILIIVVIIAIVSLFAYPSYKQSREVNKNDEARAKLLELATAVRLYNEDATTPVAGSFGNPFQTFEDPCLLFSQTPTEVGTTKAYLKNKNSWTFSSSSPCDITYRGYVYYVCVSKSGASQPIVACTDNNTGNPRLVVMELPGASGRYAGQAWVSLDDMGMVANNYDKTLPVEY
ncbi:MAG: prepilin-type N-terminal cleavage/methylation domain-containing protein [Elusimicrobiota bacterium]|jgi:prepilin-type N-terminal cleavage/methylation domain-containing protein|nr:prepilin-type N-terminal cleavage/methylation domain-containing protein [Elusimicrobiota bacterium]